MDRRLKERLVGAGILVALVVSIVPEFLAGPTVGVDASPPAAAGSPHTVTLDIAHGAPAVATAAQPGGAVARPPAARGTAEESAASSADSVASSAPSDTPLVDPTVTPAGVARAAATPAPPEHAAVGAQPGVDAERRAWSAQLGSFSSSANADKLLHSLRAQGFPAFELSGGAGIAARYRVRVGPLTDRAAADAMVGKLKDAGYPATAVAPGR